MIGERLARAMVAAYPGYVDARLAERRIAASPELDEALVRGQVWLARELGALVALPFRFQRRSPLEVFQEALGFPTEALAAAGVLPVPRDQVVANALPGDLFDLAPASSQQIGPEIWEAHLVWGAAKAAALAGRSQPVAGAGIGARRSGSGAPVVLIHGFPLDHRMWLPLIGEVGDRAVLAVDLAGRGSAPASADPVHTIERHADDVAELIRGVTDQPVHMAGLSMGGYIALALWQRHPELFRSLALLDTRAAADTEKARRGREESISGVSANGAGWLAARMLPILLAPVADQATRSALAGMIEATPVETLVADLRGMAARPDRTAVLATISVDTLVLVGSEDVVTPPAEMEELAAAVPGARFEVVLGAGHLSALEAPKVVARALSEIWSIAGSS